MVSCGSCDHLVASEHVLVECVGSLGRWVIQIENVAGLRAVDVTHEIVAVVETQLGSIEGHSGVVVDKDSVPGFVVSSWRRDEIYG